MSEHFLKVWPEYFDDLLVGLKTFEIRLNDRAYAVGDVLHLREFDPHSGCFLGRVCVRRITYRCYLGLFDRSDVVALSIVPVPVPV